MGNRAEVRAARPKLQVTARSKKSVPHVAVQAMVTSWPHVAVRAKARQGPHVAMWARVQAQLVDRLGAHQALLNQLGHHRCQPQPHVAMRVSKYQYL